MSHPTHKTRYSDSSLYDEVCTQCGATDANGMAKLNAPCPKLVHPEGWESDGTLVPR